MKNAVEGVVASDGIASPLGEEEGAVLLGSR